MVYNLYTNIETFLYLPNVCVCYVKEKWWKIKKALMSWPLYVFFFSLPFIVFFFSSFVAPA